jgi:acid stress chaperone HdeB
MEATVKLRLLLTSALFLFVQIPTMQAQVTVDVSKITCEQLLMEKLAWTERDVVLWLSGYYNGKRDNTIIDPNAITENQEKVNHYCYENRETTVMDAVKNVLGLDK